MRRDSLVMIFSATMIFGGLLLFSPATLAQTPTWLKNYRTRIQQQWDKPAGETFSSPGGSLGAKRLLNRFAGKASDKLSSVSSSLNTAAVGINDADTAQLMRKRMEDERRRQADNLTRQLRRQQQHNLSIVSRLGTRARSWVSRMLSPWFITGGFGSTVRRAAADINSRWEARLRRVNTPQPRLPLWHPHLQPGS